MPSEFVKICANGDLPEGGILSKQIGDKAVLLARYNGSVYAIDDSCSHDGGDLSEGDLVDGQIQCPRHGARFDLKTGEVTRMPAIIGIDTYEVKIDSDDIFVRAKD